MFDIDQEHFIDSVLKTDLQDFIDLNNQGTIEKKRKNSNEDFVDKNVTISFEEKTPSYENLLKKTRIPFNHQKLKDKFFNGINFGEIFSHPKDLIDNITKDVISYESYGTFIECIQFAKQMKDSMGDTFYGILLKDSNGIVINPLHPLVMLSFLDEDYKSEEVYDLFYYFYSDREEADLNYHTGLLETEGLKENINDLMLLFYSKKRDITKINSVEEYINPVNQKRNGDIEIITQRTSTEQNVFNLVAHQILSNELFVPHYGSSVVVWENNFSSCNGIGVTPMQSCNISTMNQESAGNFSNHVTKEESVTPYFNSVCVGSRANKLTYNGLRKLTYVNLNSPYNSGLCISHGALEYADACVEFCLNMYVQTGIIEEEPEGGEE